MPWDNIGNRRASNRDCNCNVGQQLTRDFLIKRNGAILDTEAGVKSGRIDSTRGSVTSDRRNRLAIYWY